LRTVVAVSAVFRPDPPRRMPSSSIAGQGHVGGDDLLQRAAVVAAIEGFVLVDQQGVLHANVSR
jgi:hypothetical protein